jgi:hypothetical protein
MNYSLEQQIEAAHAEAERIEAEALWLEARIVRTGGFPPRRQYGKPVIAKPIRENLTLVGLLNAKDPALAGFLGIQTGLHQKQQPEAAERQAAVERLRQATAQLKQPNQQSQPNRERRGSSDGTYRPNAPIRELVEGWGYRLSLSSEAKYRQRCT